MRFTRSPATPPTAAPMAAPLTRFSVAPIASMAEPTAAEIAMVTAACLAEPSLEFAAGIWSEIGRYDFIQTKLLAPEQKTKLSASTPASDQGAGSVGTTPQDRRSLARAKKVA